MGQVTANDLGANFGSIEQHVTDLNAAIAQFNGLLDEARSIVSVLSANWTGLAWGAYKIQQERWDIASTDLNATLNRITQALQQTGVDLQRTDNSNAGLF